LTSDPTPQCPHGRFGRLFLKQQPKALPRGVVDHIHQAAGALPTKRDDCHPSAPTLQNASVSLAADDAAHAVSVAATALRPPATAAAFRDPHLILPLPTSHSQTSARSRRSAAGSASESAPVALPQSCGGTPALDSDVSAPD